MSYNNIICLLVFLLFCTGCGDKTSELSEPEVSLPAYSILHRDTYDAPIKTQVEIHALVEDSINEPALRNLLDTLFRETYATQSFKNNNGKASHVFVYLYTSREHYASQMGQWVAMLSKVGNDATKDVTIKSEIIAQLGDKPVVKQGMTEAERKLIFKELVAAERRADKESQMKYPIPNPAKAGYSQSIANEQLDKQMKAMKALKQQYTDEIKEKYNLSDDQITEITLEALTGNWPMQ